MPHLSINPAHVKRVTQKHKIDKEVSKSQISSKLFL